MLPEDSLRRNHGEYQTENVMSQRKPRRWLNRLVFGLLPLLLIVGLLWFGLQLAESVARRLGEESQYTQRQPQYIQTATAMAAEPEATEAAYEIKLAAKRESFQPEPTAIAQAFATNTPQPPPATPTPEMTFTPRPLPTLFAFNGAEPGSPAGGTAVPSPVPAVDRQGQDLMNILLLGHDGELTGDGFIRTDTMIIVSINRSAGTVGMLSLPRDLYVYIPGWTMQRLNLAYIHGEAVGWTNGGFGLLRQTIFYNLGINVHYYAMVDLTGFKAIVDAVGGVELAVDCAIQDLPLIEAEVPRGAVRVNEDGEYVLPVGYYEMNGAEALWYARSRSSSSDFDRGARQQQVLRAVWRKARDSGLLANAPNLWAQGSQYIQTNLAFEDVVGLVPLALSLDPGQIETFNLRRLYDTTPWQTPDGDYVQLPIYEHINELLVDLYTAPTRSQIGTEGSTIRVVNGTANANWDRVAAERLSWEGFNAIAAGTGSPQGADTVLIDYTGNARAGALLSNIARLMNIRPENIRIQPDPNRTVDFEVILGDTYNSCTRPGVLPTDPIPAGS